MAKTKLSVDLDEELLQELGRIADRVGFNSVELLVKNYLREVLIAARVEQATSQLRDAVVRGSTDLESLIPAVKTKK